MSANTFLRSIFGCGLPLAAGPMFRTMGVGPAMSVLGAVAAVMIPVPLIFMKYGKTLRKMSKYAPVHDDDDEGEQQPKSSSDPAKKA